jgi:hypothetical protein
VAKSTTAQQARIPELISLLIARELELDRDATDWQGWCRDYAEVESATDLTESSAARLIVGLERMEERLAERVDEQEGEKA